MIDPKGTPWWKVLLAGAAVVGTSVATGAVMMVAIAGKPAFLEVHSAPLPSQMLRATFASARAGEVLLQRH